MVVYSLFKKNLLKKAYHQNTPILGEFELTKGCNFNCKMCYLNDHSSKQDLSTEEWKDIFNKAVNEGLLYALLTGGEVFSRPDFYELYTYLYDLGVKITIFSNGSMITPKIVHFLMKRPPEMVTITLYGGSNKTYQEVTKSKTGFEMVTKGINRLLEGNINVSLRTLPLYPIYYDLDKIIDFAKKRSLILNYITYLTPSEMDRLSILDLIDFEDRIKDAFSINSDTKLDKSNKETNCGALKNSYFVNSLGEMQVCALAYKPVMKIEDSLKDTFDLLRDVYFRMNDNSTCKSCSDVNNCPTCYARRLYDNKSGCNLYLKEYTHARKK